MFGRPLLYHNLIIATAILLVVPSSYANRHRRLGIGRSTGGDDFSPITSPFVSLKYHGGPLLTAPNGINVYLIWYGGFPSSDRTAITNFFASFNFVPDKRAPSVSSWRQTIRSYADKAGIPVSGTVKLAAQVFDVYSLGKNITRNQVGHIVKTMILKKKKLPLETNGIYLVLTSKDVGVEKFCMGSCNYHDDVAVSLKTKVAVAHVGHSLKCPSLCAFPFADSPFSRPGDALVAPNAIGGDAMVVNIATAIAGAATNPFKTGYYGVQGYSGHKLEVISACNGIFGAGAFPGYPGQVMVDKTTHASYNVYGASGKKFLLPAIWDLKKSSCTIA